MTFTSIEGDEWNKGKPEISFYLGGFFRFCYHYLTKRWHWCLLFLICWWSLSKASVSNTSRSQDIVWMVRALANRSARWWILSRSSWGSDATSFLFTSHWNCVWQLFTCLGLVKRENFYGLSFSLSAFFDVDSWVSLNFLSKIAFFFNKKALTYRSDFRHLLNWSSRHLFK